MFKAILFDAEGVVIDTESIWDQSQQIFLKKRGIKYDRDKVKPLLTGQSMIDGVKIMKSLPGYENLVGDDENLSKERIEITETLFRSNISFIQGFNEFYNNIKGDYKTCISTALTKKLLNLIEEKLNLTQLFQNNIFSIDDVGGISKPSPDIFIYSANKLNVKPNECIVIEDSPNGIKAAKSAGMYCIGIATTYDKEKLFEADIVVDSFNELTMLDQHLYK